MKKFYWVYWHAEYNCPQPADLRTGRFDVETGSEMGARARFWEQAATLVNGLHASSIRIEHVIEVSEDSWKRHI